MIGIALNYQHDSYLDDAGQIATFIDLETIVSNVNTNLKLWIGEADYDILDGIAYLQILGQRLSQVRQLIIVQMTAQVTKVEGVDRVIDLNFIFSSTTRTCKIIIQIKLDTGIIINVTTSLNLG
jgi:hypothetical protein